jgi:tetratricopeptide (TPR) repeat protein
MSTRALSPWSSVKSAALLCALIAIAFHFNALGNEFAYDDVHFLPEHEELHDARNLPRLMLEPYWPGEFGTELGLWRPGTTLSLGLQWALWQDRGMPYHLVNVIAHGAATALVVLLLGALATVPIALLGGLVFAVHPVHVEAVSNIVGLAEVQAAVFFLAACLVHLRAGPALRATDEPRARYGPGRIAGVTALYLGAFLTKESAVTLPGAVFLLDCARERLGLAEVGAYLRRRWPLYAALAAAAALVLAVRFAVLGSLAAPLGPLGADLLAQGVPRIWTVAGIWTHYVRLMVFPADLSSDYSPNVLPIGLGWQALNIAGVALALMFLALAWVTWRDRDLERGSTSSRLIAFGVMWFVITISPISNVFFVAGVLLAERTLYLPSVGAVAVAGWLLARLVQNRPRVGWTVVTAVVLGMGVHSWRRTPTWEHTGTVFETMLRDYPQSGRSQWVLGDLFYMQGRVPESLRSYRIAIGILGGHHQLMTEIGKKLIGAKRYRAAEFVLEHAWQEEPEWGVAPGYLAISRFNQRDWLGAERWARVSLAADPDDPTISHILAGTLAEAGRYAEAIPWRENAIANGEGDRWEQWVALARLKLSVSDSAGARAAADSARARATTPEEIQQIGKQFAPYVPPTLPAGVPATLPADVPAEPSAAPRASPPAK